MFALPRWSLVLSTATSYFIKPGRAIFLLFFHRRAPSMSHEILPVLPWSLIRNDMGSCFPFRETNSTRPGSYLWSFGEGLAPPRRRALRRTRHGRNSFWKRHSLASRHR